MARRNTMNLQFYQASDTHYIVKRVTESIMFRIGVIYAYKNDWLYVTEGTTSGLTRYELQQILDKINELHEEDMWVDMGKQQDKDNV